MRDVVERGDLERLGALLHEAFVAKKQMNPHIAEDTPIEAMLERPATPARPAARSAAPAAAATSCRGAPPERRRASARRWNRSAASSRRSTSTATACARRGATTPGRPRRVNPPVRPGRPRRNDQPRGRPPDRSRRTGTDPRLGRGDAAPRGPRARHRGRHEPGRGRAGQPRDRPPGAIHARSARSSAAGAGGGRDPLCPHAPKTAARVASRDRAWRWRRPSDSGSIPRTRSSWAIMPATWAWAGPSGPPPSSCSRATVSRRRAAREAADHVVDDLAAAVNIIAGLVAGEPATHRPREATRARRRFRRAADAYLRGAAARCRPLDVSRRHRGGRRDPDRVVPLRAASC